jgi:two-component system chemotaxis response regulator CheB
MALITNKIKVLIVDDSALVRQTLKAFFDETTDIEVIATAADPYIAVKKMQKEAPDVITLDIEMPRMDGLTFLKKLMSQHPIPVVIISSVSEKNSYNAIKALEYGAIEIINKPQLSTKEKLAESKTLIVDKVRAAARSRVKRFASNGTITNIPHTRVVPEFNNDYKVEPKLDADAILTFSRGISGIQTTQRIIAVGASTGGTEALRVFLQAMPRNSPAIVIVQHMPPVFTKSFADRLNELCEIEVREAKDGDSVLPGLALIAPGSHHILLKRSGARYYVETNAGPLVNRHRPSVDVLFRSAAIYSGMNTIGVILTGMGDDGARGMAEMKERGAFNIAQDENTCVVFGMPKEAIKHGGTDVTLPLDQIAPHIIRKLNLK